MVHDRIADQDHLEQTVASLARALEQLPDQLVERAPHRFGELTVAARVHHHVRDPAHQVLTEPDLRVHATGAGEHLTGREVAQVAGDRRRPDVDGHAEGGVDVAGPDGDETVGLVDGDRDRALLTVERGLQRRQHVETHRWRGTAVLLEQRPADRADGCEIVARLAELELRHLDVPQPERRVDGDRREVEVLAHHLPVDLAGRRDVDHDVATDAGGATQPVTGDERAVAAVVGLDRRRRPECVRSNGDRPLGERALSGHYLATTTDAAATAHRVEVGAETARRIEHGGAVLDRSAQTGRREDDPMLPHGAPVSPFGDGGPRDRRGRLRRRGRSGRGWRGSRWRSSRRCPSTRRRRAPLTWPRRGAGS